MALSWITWYLTECQQHVCHSGKQSTSQYISIGVPQDFVLGPLLFVLYTADLAPLIADHRLNPHLYADDTQVYGWCWPTDVNLLQARMSRCNGDVWSWTRSNRLQVNPAKTEFVWCAPSRRRHHIPTSDVLVCNDPIHPLQSVRDLGVYVDEAMTIRTHISHVLSSCFSALRLIKSFKRSLSAHALTTLVTALVQSRLDYCNVVFAGLPNCDILRLRSFLNTAVRVSGDIEKYDPGLSQLLHANHAIWPTSSRSLPQRPPEQASDPPLLALSQRHVPRHHSVTARSLWPLRALVKVCRHHFVEFIPLTLSAANSKRFSLLRLFSFCWSFYFIFNCILLVALVVFTHLRRRNLDFFIDW